MTKLVDIKDKESNPRLIRHLEQLLDFARKGELRSLAYCAAWDDDSVNHRWVHDARTGKILLAGPGEIAMNPDGHGGSLKALRASGAIESTRCLSSAKLRSWSSSIPSNRRSIRVSESLEVDSLAPLPAN